MLICRDICMFSCRSSSLMPADRILVIGPHQKPKSMNPGWIWLEMLALCWSFFVPDLLGRTRTIWVSLFGGMRDQLDSTRCRPQVWSYRFGLALTHHVYHTLKLLRFSSMMNSSGSSNIIIVIIIHDLICENLMRIELLYISKYIYLNNQSSRAISSHFLQFNDRVANKCLLSSSKYGVIKNLFFFLGGRVDFTLPAEALF